MSTLFHPESTGVDTLTDRYVHAVTRRLPADQRDDVARELKGSIADRADAIAAEQPELDDLAAERSALEELGDPDRLAASYSGRRLQLIGPELYPSYVTLLRSLLLTVVPIVAAVVGIAAAFSDDSLGSAIGSAVWTAITVAVHVAFWVTLVYALIERGIGGDASRSALGVEWSPDQLPDLPSQRGSLTDAVGSVVFLVLLGVAIVWQQVRSPITEGDERLPLLDPALWSFWLPLILVLLVAEMAFEVVRYRTARIRPTLNMLIGAAFAAPLVILGATDQLLNPAAVAQIQRDWAEFNPDVAHTVVAVSAVVIWLWDSVEGWRRDRSVPAA